MGKLLGVGARRGCALAALVCSVAPVGAQGIRGIVRDSASGRPLAGAAVSVVDLRDWTPCSVAAGLDGRFRCALPADGEYSVTARHIGYVPLRRRITVLSGSEDSVTIALSRAAVTLDTVRTLGAADKRRFGLTPGHEQFQEHMALGKGHFISGFDVQRASVPLSAYLVTNYDSLALVDFLTSRAYTPIPGVPVANDRFLTSKVGHQCLYARIDHLNIIPLLARNGADDIDEVLGVDQIIGVELYLSYEDVPESWRADATPAGIVDARRRSQKRYVMGDIGRPRVEARRWPMTIPACPFLQIWTRAAW